MKIKVTVNGLEIKNIDQLSLVQRFDWHHNVELTVPLNTLEGGDKLRSAKQFMGAPIIIEFRPASGDNPIPTGADNTQGKFVFKGSVTSVTLNKTGGNNSLLLIKGFSNTVALDDGIGITVFSEKNLSQIYQDILSKYTSLKFKVDLKNDPFVGYLVRYNESNFNFLSRISQQFGQWFYYNGEKLIIGASDISKDTCKLIFGSQLETYNFDLNIAPLKFKVKSYDYSGNNTLEGNSENTDIGQLNSDDDIKQMMKSSDSFFNQSHLFHPQEFFKAQTDLQSYVKHRKSGLVGDMVAIKGKSTDFRLRLGSKIRIDSGSNDLDSKVQDEFMIIGVSHFFDSTGNYYNFFEGVPKEIQFPPMHRNFIMPPCETQAAVVVKNNDKAKMGRVKVRFKWQSQNESSPWIRVVNMHSGKNKGFQFIPEIQDEVLVAFENQNVSFPYVIGSLYHGNAKHEDRQDNNNYIKTIRTVSGNEIRFNDKGKEEELSIFNKGQQNEIILTLKEGGSIIIKSSNKIDIKAKEINIHADKKITMTSQQIQITADNTFKVESKETAIEGEASAKVKSSGTLDLNATGITTLKGKLVKIN